MPGLKRPGSGRAFWPDPREAILEELSGLLILRDRNRIPRLINLACPQRILIATQSTE